MTSQTNPYPEFTSRDCANNIVNHKRRSGINILGVYRGVIALYYGQ